MCRLEQLVPRTLYIKNLGTLPLTDRVLSFESNILNSTRGSNNDGLAPYVQGTVWSTLGARGASSWVSPKGIQFVWTKTIP